MRLNEEHQVSVTQPTPSKPINNPTKTTIDLADVELIEEMMERQIQFSQQHHLQEDQEDEPEISFGNITSTKIDLADVELIEEMMERQIQFSQQYNLQNNVKCWRTTLPFEETISTALNE
mgnify:CR=1 FL=1